MFAILGYLTGWFAWGNSDKIIPLWWIVILPILWGMTQTRGQAFTLIAGYYFSASRSLPDASSAFFGDAAPWWLGPTLWYMTSVLLALPFVCLWVKNKHTRAVRFVFAVCMTVIPPLGLIGWTSPLAIAGCLFPGMAWFGIVLTMAVFWASVAQSKRGMILLMMVSLITNVGYSNDDVKVLQSWHGVDTHYPQLGSDGASDSSQLLMALERIEGIRLLVKNMPSNTVHVLPETILGSINGVMHFLLQDIENALIAKGSRLVVGAEMPLHDGRYQNVAIILGVQNNDGKKAVQSVPVPLGMWKPWSSSGAVADIFGFGNVININGSHVGVLICYEQALPFVYLKTMLEQPHFLISMSNLWWANRPDVPNIQHQTLSAFNRLFSMPVVMAKNT